LFRPRQGRTVTWYTCGPTVYDACHMGHARAYLTFDILRRIMEDYFHFDLLYQLNITDVDDKIILRARQNKLMADYQSETQDLATVQADVEVAMAALHQKLQQKVKDLQEALPPDTPSKQVLQRQEELETATFKLDQFTTGSVQAVQELKASGNTTIADWMTASHDALAAHLDALRGSTVTDPQIYQDHARKFEREFWQDMTALGVKEPDVVTRVTEYVPQITEYIQGIIDNGFAYASDSGSVYFDTAKFKGAGYDYRKLKPGEEISAAEMAEGEGALAGGSSTEKKHSFDFALWKASKPGEPSWESPWGPGRPGWHIECSVMASDIIGENIDIHGGGVDLMFPHHDNEMAQAEAYHKCCQWVNYFLHAGHLHIKGLKMSKSLKNFITIRQALQEHSPRQLRFMFLMQPWDKSMNYSDQTVDDAKKKESYFKNFFGAVKSVLRQDFVSQIQGWTAADKALFETLNAMQAKVHASLLDNFKTYEVIQHLVDLVTECNKYLGQGESGDEASQPKNLLVQKVAIYVTKILRVLGVVQGNDVIGFGDGGSGGGASSKEDVAAPFVDALVQFRDQVRTAARNKAEPVSYLQECDAVRDGALAQLGVRIEDSTGASIWKMDDPAVIQKEIADKRQKAAEAAAKKRQGKIDKLVTDIAKAKQAMIPLTKFFQQGEHADKWGTYDEATGKPLTTKDGQELSKSQVKSLAKEAKNQEKARDKLVKQAGGTDDEAALLAYIGQLEQELNDLQASS